MTTLPVRLVGFLLALLPALALAAVYNGVGYFQTQLQEKSLYWKIVAITNLAPTVAVLLTVHDRYFDDKYGGWIGPLGRPVVLVRMFVPSLGLVAALMWAGRAASGPELLIACALSGLAGGWLNYFSSTLVATQGRGELRQAYVAVGAASLLTIALYELTGFGAASSRRDFRTLMDLFALCVLVLLGPAAWLHFGSKVDYSRLFADREETEPLVAQGRAGSAPGRLVTAASREEAEAWSDGGEYMQLFSSTLDLIPLPLLPVLFTPSLAQLLMTCRLWAEALAVALLYVGPSSVPAAWRLGLLLGRVALLGVLGFFLPWSDQTPALLGVWFLFSGSGLLLGAWNDLAPPEEAVKAYLRRLRIGHHVGMLCGLAIAAALIVKLDGGLDYLPPILGGPA